MKRKKKKNQIVLPPGHKKLVTRRDFVSHGLMGAVSYMLVPSVLSSLYSRQALGAGCATTTGSTMVPLIVIDCSGGAGLSGNWLPKDAGGAALPKYRRVGVPETNPALTNMHGHNIVTSRSSGGVAGIYNSLNDTRLMSAAAKQKLQFGIFCIAALNDTKDNPLNISVLAAQAGLVGKNFEAPITSTSVPSGMRSRSPVSNSQFKPLYIKSVDSAVDALSMGSALNTLNAAQRETIMKYVGRLSESQVEKLKSMNQGEQLKALAECASARNMSNVNPNPNVDPRQFNNMVQAWNLNDPDPADPTDPLDPASFESIGTKMTNARRGQLAAITHNVLAGNAGIGIITVGGCDYHNSLPVDDPGHGDQKDREIGEIIARIVESAHRMQTPVAISIVSDGSVSVGDANLGARIWTSDSRANCIAAMGFYDPKHVGGAIGSKDMLRTQVGHFKYSENGGKEKIGVDSSPVSNPLRGVYAMFLNYLALNYSDADSRFVKMLGERVFSPSDIPASLLFNPRNNKKS